VALYRFEYQDIGCGRQEQRFIIAPERKIEKSLNVELHSVTSLLKKSGSPVSNGKNGRLKIFSHRFHGFSLTFFSNPRKSVKSVARFLSFPLIMGDPKI